MQLEWRRHDMRKFILASAWTSLVLLGMLSLFAFAPHLDPDPELRMFARYDTLTALYSVLSVAAFGTLSAVLASKVVIEEYSARRSILLFSYPVPRARVMLAKLAVVYLFAGLALLACNLLVFTVFGVSEAAFALVDDTLTGAHALEAGKHTGVMALAAGAIGVVATGIGFRKRSVPTTIISAVIISSLLCNVMFNLLHRPGQEDVFVLASTLVLVVMCLLVAAVLMRAAEHMEVC